MARTSEMVTASGETVKVGAEMWLDGRDLVQVWQLWSAGRTATLRIACGGLRDGEYYMRKGVAVDRLQSRRIAQAA